MATNRHSASKYAHKINSNSGRYFDNVLYQVFRSSVIYIANVKRLEAIIKNRKISEFGIELPFVVYALTVNP